MTSSLLILALVATPLAAQLPKPVIEQPSRPSRGTAPTHVPSVAPNARQTSTRRAARSDTTEILEALAHNLKVQIRRVMDSDVTIQHDTAWVTLHDPLSRGSVYRIERRHNWRVVDQ
jgi:hypothetical protein